jgi:hypothetical protein
MVVDVEVDNSKSRLEICSLTGSIQTRPCDQDVFNNILPKAQSVDRHFLRGALFPLSYRPTTDAKLIQPAQTRLYRNGAGSGSKKYEPIFAPGNGSEPVNKWVQRVRKF